MTYRSGDDAGRWETSTKVSALAVAVAATVAVGAPVVATSGGQSGTVPLAVAAPLFTTAPSSSRPQPRPQIVDGEAGAVVSALILSWRAGPIRAEVAMPTLPRPVRPLPAPPQRPPEPDVERVDRSGPVDSPSPVPTASPPALTPPAPEPSPTMSRPARPTATPTPTLTGTTSAPPTPEPTTTTPTPSPTGYDEDDTHTSPGHRRHRG